MKHSSRRQKGKRFENQVADLICKVFELDNLPIEIKPKRNFTSGASIYEKGDINLGVLSLQLSNVVIECKKWNNILNSKSTIKRLYKKYSEKFPDKILWLVVAGNYQDPHIVFDINNYPNFDKLSIKIDDNLRIVKFDIFLNEIKKML